MKKIDPCSHNILHNWKGTLLNADAEGTNCNGTSSSYLGFGALQSTDTILVLYCRCPDKLMAPGDFTSDQLRHESQQLVEYAMHGPVKTNKGIMCTTHQHMVHQGA